MTDEEGAKTMTPRILAFAGSLRRESFNKKLVPIAAKGARDAGAEVTLIGLEDFPLPLFDQDLEARQGMPENGKKLKQLFIDHDGLLIASPEYNSSITAVLKNAIDWVSRPAPGEPSLVAFRSKVATLMSASPGALGGLRGLVGTISRRIICSGQLFAQFFRSHPEELPEAQRGQLQAQEAVRRLMLSVPGPELV